MKAKGTRARIYKGVAILPADRNSSGIRWTANMGIGFTLRAETLQGMKELIRYYKKNPPKE